MTIRGLAIWATLYITILFAGCGAGSGRSGTDLVVTGIGPSATLNGGDTAVFLMTITNKGDYAAEDVTIRTVLSQLSQASLSIICTAKGGAACPESVGSTMTLSSFPSGGALDFQISATSIAGASGTVGDTLTVTSDSTDTDSSNNTLTVSTPVVSNDISVTATPPPGPLVNGPATFTMLISNAGPNDASNVVLTTTTSANVAFKPSDISCVANPNIDTTVVAAAAIPTAQADGTLLSPLIPSSGGLTCSVPVTVADATNGFAIVTMAASAVGDARTGNNAGTGTVSATLVNDLSVTALAPTGPLVNGAATFTMTIDNAGPSSASAVTIVNTLSSALSLAGNIDCVASGGAAKPTLQADGTLVAASIPPTGQIVCSVPTVAAAGTNGLISDTLSVTAANDPKTSNNSATGVVSATLVYDLSVTALAPPGPIVDSAAVFTMLIDNLGPSTATSVVITNTPGPALGLTGAVACTATGGATTPVLQPDGTLIAASVPPSAQLVCTVPTLVASGTNGLVSDTLSVSSTNDPKPGNNTATAIVSATLVNDVSVSVAAPPGPLVNQVANFTTTVVNTGPSTATSVAITNTLSAALSPSGPVACTASDGATAPTLQGDGTLLAASMPPASRIVCNVTATVAIGTNAAVSNTATVRTANDPNTSNNTATGTVGATLVSDLSVVGAAPVGPLVDPTAIFTMTIGNAGPAAASSVIVTNTPGPLLTLNGSIVCVPSGGATAPTMQPDGTLLVASLPPSSKIVCSVPTRVAAGTNAIVSDTLSVAATNDPNTINNTATVSVGVTLVNDISVSVTAPVGPLVSGDATFTATIGNSGPAPAASVVIASTLSSSLSLNGSITCAATGGATAPTRQNDGTLLVATMPPMSQLVCSVPTTVAAGTSGLVSETVSATAANDPNPANNTAAASVNATLTNNVGVTAGPAATSVLGGATTTFTFDVGNTGPSTAFNVALTNVVSANLTLISPVSCVAAGGATAPLASSGGALNVASIPVGGTISCSVSVVVTAGANGTVNSTLTAAAANDQLAVNNSATAATLAVSSDLGVSQTVQPAQVKAGSAATFTAVVGNPRGQGTATNMSIRLVQTVPSGSLVTFSQLTCTPTGGGVCPTVLGATMSVPSLPPGATLAFSYTANTAASDRGLISNTVSVTADSDPNLSNNSATSTTTAVDPRNGPYTVFAANGLGYKLTIDFDAGSYTMEGQGQSVQRSFMESMATAPSTSEFTVNNDVRFKVSQDLIVGSHDFSTGLVPYVAARAFAVNVTQIGGSYNIMSRNISSLATTHAGTALISQNTLSVCESDTIQVTVARSCDASALKVYNLTTSAAGGFVGTTASNELYAFSVANVGASKILLSTSIASDATKEFKIGLIDSTGGLTYGKVSGSSIAPNAVNRSDWVQIMLTTSVVNTTQTPVYTSSGANMIDSASLRTFGPNGAGPFSMLTGTSLLYNAPLYVMQASPLIVVTGGGGLGGAGASGLIQIGLP